LHRIVEGRSFTPVITTKANKMKNYKKYPVTVNGLQFFIQYLGSQVGGQLKWHITSADIPNIDEDIDTLWHTKQEAIEAIQELVG